ncbi:MAG: hypothetical protein K2G70_04660 [Turicibacter sp.]|nr:hypothetical protein [Turicibacter sp.]
MAQKKRYQVSILLHCHRPKKTIEKIEIDILNFLLDLSPRLKATYGLYQDLLFMLQTKNLTRFNHLLEAEHPLISPDFKPLLKPLKYINLTFRIS